MASQGFKSTHIKSTNNMDRNESISAPSLLLQASTTFQPWSDASGSAILMPVTQEEANIAPPTELDTEQHQRSSLPSGSFSRLMQPLRPSQGRSPSPSNSSQTPSSTPPPPSVSTLHSVTSGQTSMSSGAVSDTSNFRPPPAFIASQQMPSVIPHAAVSPFTGNVGPPPIGPAQNFRRQGPTSYAPTVGLGGDAHSTVSSEQFQPPITEAQNYPPYSTTMQPQELPPPTIHTMEEQMATPSAPIHTYKPVQPHWFYRKEIEKKTVWLPFSMLDSTALEEACHAGLTEKPVLTDGNRYHVYINQKLRKAIYWEEDPVEVRRCSWFFKADGQNRFYPYAEDFAERLEEQYHLAITTNRWHQRLEFPGSETIVMHNPSVVLHFLPSSQPDEWGNVIEGQVRPRVVKRGVSEQDEIPDGETSRVDHLVFVVHGIGAICDLRFRTVVECVDDFRAMALSLQSTHYKQHVDVGRIGRVEFLPVSWHKTLHGDATGIDSQMKPITLPSIPKLRHFSNDTILDVLFYTSPVYCQTMVDIVASEVNRLYALFLNYNPHFHGGVSLAGHSLGSLILFDILAHQQGQNPSLPEPLVIPERNCEVAMREASPGLTDTLTKGLPEEEEAGDVKVLDLDMVFQSLGLAEYTGKFHEEQIDLDTLKMCSENDLKEMGLPMGPRKKLLAFMKELAEKEEANKRTTLEPLPMPLSTSSKAEVQHSNAREVQRQSSVASVNYTMGPTGIGQPFVNYPEFNFTPSCFFALGSPIAMFLSVRGVSTLSEDYKLPTCPAFFNIFHPFDPVAYRMEPLIDPNWNLNPVLIPHHKGRKRMHLELKDSIARMGTDLKQRIIDSLRYTWNSISDFARAHSSSPHLVEAEVDRVVQEEISSHQDADEVESTASTTEHTPEEDIQIGQLNGGRRIDYVLQEKPIEIFNEYLFALGSHACYWESEDTVLLILREVYSLMGVHPERPRSSTTGSKVYLYNPAVARPSAVLLPPSSGTGVPLTGSNPPMPYNPPVALQNSPASVQQSAQFAAPPTVNPVAPSQPVGPPPLSGFVKQSPLLKR